MDGDCLESTGIGTRIPLGKNIPEKLQLESWDIKTLMPWSLHKLIIATHNTWGCPWRAATSEKCSSVGNYAHSLISACYALALQAALLASLLLRSIQDVGNDL